MDAITWSFPTKGGAKNAYIMGDDGVGYLDCLNPESGVIWPF
eukprot:COSAG01_NODE_11400_length_1942_cov_12.961497_1_plen_42_part_00